MGNRLQAMSKKTVSKKTPTFGTKRQVWNKKALKTKGGLSRKDLKMNKHGKIVSRAQSKAKNGSSWMVAVKKARAQLNIKGFYAIKKGTELYALAKCIQAGTPVEKKVKPTVRATTNDGCCVM